MAERIRFGPATEHQSQAAIIAWLDLVLPPTIRAVGVSNNPRSRVTGAFEKARGMRKGFPDVLLTGAFHGFLEVKKHHRYLRPEQREWRDFLEGQGIPVAVVRSIEDVRSVLAAWGVATREGDA